MTVHFSIQSWHVIGSNLLFLGNCIGWYFVGRQRGAKKR